MNKTELFVFKLVTKQTASNEKGKVCIIKVLH